MTSPYDPQHHHPRSIRLPGWDYAAPGAYFVTVCAQQRRCLFGNVVAADMRLNTYGRLVDTLWRRNLALSPHIGLDIGLDIIQVMPNHLHAIIVIEAADAMSDATPALPSDIQNTTEPTGELPLGRSRGPKSGELGAIVGNLKAVCTRRINRIRHAQGETIWQRNYWEHIIRDEDEINRTRTYIATNPARWLDDQLYMPETGEISLD